LELQIQKAAIFKKLFLQIFRVYKNTKWLYMKNTPYRIGATICAAPVLVGSRAQTICNALIIDTATQVFLDNTDWK
jgi:hypothetical protein